MKQCVNLAGLLHKLTVEQGPKLIEENGAWCEKEAVKTTTPDVEVVVPKKFRD